MAQIYIIEKWEGLRLVDHSVVKAKTTTVCKSSQDTQAKFLAILIYYK